MDCSNFDLKRRLLHNYNKHLDHSGINGLRLASRLAKISEIGLTNDKGSHRLGYSSEEKQAKKTIIKWMKDIGLVVNIDSAGNVIGKFTGENEHLPAILTGSHIDTVPNGGHFDGVLGVLTALEVFESWRESSYIPKRTCELAVFSDEEGSRFNAGLIGSKAMVGDINLSEIINLKDHNGVSFERVIKEYGLSANNFTRSKRDIKEVDAFVEVHIEQGTQLELKNAPVGIVTGIAGQNGLEFQFSGVAGHAGNTPMTGRKDALVAAGDFIKRINSFPSKVSSTAVATVGKLQVFPNGSNVIPNEVKLSVDIRDINQNALDELTDLIIQEAKQIELQYSIEIIYKASLKVKSVPVNNELLNIQSNTLKKLKIDPVYIPSGAGHDAMILGKRFPMAMFFVRSKDGLSHNPKEWTCLNDCVMGAHVLKAFIEELEKQI